MAQIDSKLAQAASQLSGLESQSDARGVDYAVSYVGEINGLIDRLSGVTRPSAYRQLPARRGSGVIDRGAPPESCLYRRWSLKFEKNTVLL